MVEDNTRQDCNKYSSFAFTPDSELAYGNYQVSVIGVDIAGNSSEATIFDLNVSRNATSQTSKPKPEPGPQPKPKPQESTPSASLDSTPSATASATINISTAVEIIDEIIEVLGEVSNYATKVAQFAVQSLVARVQRLESPTPPPVPESLERPGEITAAVTDVTIQGTAVAAAGSVMSATVVSTVVVTQSMAPIYATTARVASALPLDVVKGLFLGLLQHLSNLSSVILGVSIRRKKNNTGVVFDSHTHKPVSGVFVVSFSPSGNLSSDFTDIQGRYKLRPRPDVYTLKASKKDYLFPSQIITVPATEVYAHIYQPEEKIEITDAATHISNISIPIDPKLKISNTQKLIKAGLHRFSYFLKKFRKPLTFGSLVVTGLAFFTHPTIYYLSAFALNSTVSFRFRSKKTV